MVALPSTLKGNWALIWAEETKIIGTGTPLTVRHESASAVGSGTSLVAILTGLRLLP